MLRWMRLILPAMAVVLAAGCNTMSGQPQFVEAALTPPVLHPDESGVLTVKVKDKHAIVNGVKCVAQEYPEKALTLKDDGEAPDVKPGDGTWTLSVDVPPEAPPGDFTMEFTAYRSDGLPITVRDDQGNVVPMKALLPVRIDPLPEPTLVEQPPAPAEPEQK